MSQISMKAFFADRGGPEHGGQRLIWGGDAENRLPFRGNYIPDLRGDEVDDLQLGVVFGSKMFKLWEPADKVAFDKIKQRAEVGWYVIKKCEYHFVEAKEHYLVWMEWSQYYNELANEGGYDDD